MPLKVTVLDPCVEPKLAPFIVTDAPTVPVVGERLLIVGDLPASAAPARSSPMTSGKSVRHSVGNDTLRTGLLVRTKFIRRIEHLREVVEPSTSPMDLMSRI